MSIKSILLGLLLALLAFMTSLAIAADACPEPPPLAGVCPEPPPLAQTCDEPEPLAVVAAAPEQKVVAVVESVTAVGFCPEPPPIAGTCSTDASEIRYASSGGAYCGDVVYEEKIIPVLSKVWTEETYTANEVRSEIVNELRTRTAVRMVPYLAAKEVPDSKFKPVVIAGSKAPRLSRRVTQKTVVFEAHERQEYEEEYIVPVRHTEIVPVTRTRMVATTVQEMKTVTVPVKTTQEKAVKKRRFW